LLKDICELAFCLVLWTTPPGGGPLHKAAAFNTITSLPSGLHSRGGVGVDEMNSLAGFPNQFGIFVVK
jgi:hypothetical protein